MGAKQVASARTLVCPMATAHLNQQHCPSQGPCKLDGMQMIGEVIALYAIPPAFIFGILSALFITIVKRE